MLQRLNIAERLKKRCPVSHPPKETEAYEAMAVRGISPGTIKAYSDFFKDLENMISLATKQVVAARKS